MRAHLIVVKAQVFSCHARLLDSQKQAFVQAFITALTVKALDERILDRLSGSNELQLDADAVRPFIDG
jgi:hypothetical protein